MATVKIKDKKSPAEEKKEVTHKNLKKPSEWKSEATNLVKGTATPYIALFEETGNPIINPLTGIPLGAYMTKFTFKGGDENEDNLSVTFDTGNPDASDISEIQEGKSINVQWGYIYPDGTFKSSKVHLLQIKQLEAVFDDKGTHLTLTCKDSVSNLRHGMPFKPSGRDNYNMLDFLNDGVGVDVGIIIEMFE